MSTFHLQVITPEATIFDGNVTTVTVPVAEGEFGVYAQHAPVVSQVVPGEVSYVNAQGLNSIAIGEGFVEVTATTVKILTDMAVMEAEIDEKVIQEALQRAQDALRSKTLIGEELEATEAQIARTSAQLKLKRKRRPAV